MTAATVGLDTILHDIQRSTEKQQELEHQQQTDLLGTGFSKLPDTLLASSVPGTKITYSQDLRPNGINQISSSGQYHHTLSTSSVLPNLSITNASANRTTAAPYYSYTSLPSTTIGPSLGNVVSTEGITTTNAYHTDIASIQSNLRESQVATNLENLHNEELMLELALNKSKEKGSGVGNITLGQPTTNFDDLVATMAPPPSCMTMPTTYSNAFPTTMTSDIYTTKRDEYNNNEKDLIIGSGGSTSGLSGTIGIGSRLHGTSITGGLLGSNTAGGTSTEMLSNYKSHPGSVFAGGGGGGGITTDFDSVSQLSQKAYTNTMAQIPRTSGGMIGGSGGNMTIGDLANLETSDTSVIDYNLVNEEMKYRANLDNMYKKDPYTTTTATGVYSTAGDETSGLESSFTSPSAQFPGLVASDGRHQKKQLIEQYLNKSSYMTRDPLTNQAISAANAAQAAAAAVASAAAAAVVTSSSNLPYGSTSFPPSSAPMLNNALALSTAYGMSGLPATNAMLEDLIEEKELLMNHVHDAATGGSALANYTGSSLGMMGMTGMSSMMPLGGLVPQSALVQHQGPTAVVDMLEIPGKGRCSVFFARYSYDPCSQSLNEFPEAELQVGAGDYVLVWGEADEDGYFEGETLDGRRGQIPSNYIERLCGEDLLEFHREVVMGLGLETSDSNDLLELDPWSTSVPTNLPLDAYGVGGMGSSTLALSTSPEVGQGEPNMPYHFVHDEHLLNATYYSPDIDEQALDSQYGILGPGMSGINTGINAGIDTSPTHINQLNSTAHHQTANSHVDVTGSVVPAPRQLTLERQLNKSILIGWTAPDCQLGQIEMYHVYVDGFLRTTVRASDKTRALVEGVDCARQPHRISVRSVTVNRKTSKDAACTMIIGKDAPLGPSCVKASAVTATSAVISWLPSNSNFQHTVCINSVEVRTVKPGVYKHTITGLTPNTTYKVTIRAKNIKASPFVDEKSLARLLEKLSAHTEFKTQNKALPDPPMDVRVDGGPQDGTILVTWIPSSGQGVAQRQAPVTGYAVFADGKRVTDVDSPTSDHALVDLGCIGHFNPKLITVRSKSRDLLSIDSSAVPIQSSKVRKPVRGGDPRMRYGASTQYGRGGMAAGQGGGRGISKPRMQRGFRDATGQLIVDHDDGMDNLSDKEIYARNIPAIEITRDSISEFDAYSDEDYETGGRYRRGHHGAHHRRRRGGHGAHGGGGVGDGSRIFVALFDYDPPTMSPNPEACEEELPFREGQLIKIIGEKDADGFYWGECGNRSGYVPCNMVSEVQVDDERMVRDLLKDDNRNRGMRGAAGVGGMQANNRDRYGDTYANNTTKKMIALYDYDPQELSPNVDAEVELSFRTGDVITVYGDMDDDGFYMAELRGQRGLVPSNFLTDAPNQGKSLIGGMLSGITGNQGGLTGPPPPPRGGMMQGMMPGKKADNLQQPAQAKPATTPLGMQTLTGGLTNLFSSKPKVTEVQPTVPVATQPQTGFFGQQQQPAVAPRTQAQPVQQHQQQPYQPQVAAAPIAPAAPAAPVTFDLDKIPGLDDDFEPVPTAPRPGARPSAAGLKPGQKPGEAEGGLLGGLTSGISGLASGGIGGVTGKVGDLTGGAGAALGGGMKAAGGLFKKFGF